MLIFLISIFNVLNSSTRRSSSSPVLGRTRQCPCWQACGLILSWMMGTELACYCDKGCMEHVKGFGA